MSHLPRGNPNIPESEDLKLSKKHLPSTPALTFANPTYDFISQTSA